MILLIYMFCIGILVFACGRYYITKQVDELVWLILIPFALFIAIMLYWGSYAKITINNNYEVVGEISECNDTIIRELFDSEFEEYNRIKSYGAKPIIQVKVSKEIKDSTNWIIFPHTYNMEANTIYTVK